MRLLSYVFLLIIMLVGLTFAALNPNTVTFNYYLGSKDIVLSFLLVGAFGGGIFLGLSVAVLSWLKVKRENLRLKSRLKIIEKEVENLRSIPIKGE